MPRYVDRNGKEIKSGMYLRHDDGTIDLVYDCVDSNGKDDLGFNASTERWIERTGVREIYPLYQFDLKEFEIIEQK